MMPETIAGADGSEHSRRALEWATSEAEARHAPLAVLSVHRWRAVTHPESDLDQRPGAGE
jgi:nucleotide-binding universal stress UspA family protein